MPQQHSRSTIVSMAVVAAGLTVLMHEGIGHGVVAWLRDDVPTQLTSNHLSTLRADCWVDAGGTLVNLAVGVLSLAATHAARSRANVCYFFWIVAAHNLFAGTGYFAFSGAFGFGDWQEVIRGWPYQAGLRTAMFLLGAGLYYLAARLLAIALHPFCAQRPTYNAVGRLPYLASCLFNCAAGAFDPLGLKLFLVSTVPGTFGGSSGLLWLDSLMPREAPRHPLIVARQAAWWIAAALFATAYIAIVGRGINLSR